MERGGVHQMSLNEIKSLSATYKSEMLKVVLMKDKETHDYLMEALEKVREQEDEIVAEIWETEGKIDEITTDAQKGITRAVARLDREIQGAEL